MQHTRIGHLAARTAVVTALLAVAPSMASSQTTVFSTFGPGDSYNGCGVPVGTADALSVIYVTGFESWVASGFVYGGATGSALSSIRFAADDGSLGFYGPLDVAFMDGATIGGASVLESWSVASAGSSNGPSIYSLSSITRPTLTSGETYWVRLRPGDETGVYWSWCLGDQQGGTGIYWSQNQLENWSQINSELPAAFDVTATVAPEPATVTLFAAGLLGLVGARLRRRRKAQAGSDTDRRS